MQPRVLRGVKNLLADRAEELRALAVSFSGGEPLEARELVFDLLEHARALRRRHPELAFTSDLSTGGDLLDRRTFERLVDLGVSEFRVTFDGRDLRSGRERAWRNLAALREVRRPFTVCVRVPGVEDEGVGGEGMGDLERYHSVLQGDSRFDLSLCNPPRGVDRGTRGGRGATAFVVRPDGRVERCSPGRAQARLL